LFQKLLRIYSYLFAIASSCAHLALGLISKGTGTQLSLDNMPWKGDDLCDGDPELHHTFIEFSQINQVDPDKIEKSLGLHFKDDEEFQVWAESPGNLEVLCVAHHRAHYGIHVIPGPLWEALRFRKKGSEAAAEFVPASELAS